MIVKIKMVDKELIIKDKVSSRIDWFNALKNDNRFIFVGDGSVIINKDHVISVSFEESGGSDVKND